MSNSNVEFSKALLFSVAADYFMISKQLGMMKDKNFQCNKSLANIYKPLFSDVGIVYGEWVEPFSGDIMFCSPSDDESKMDDFFDHVEELCIRINMRLRQQFNIPIPQIYTDGKVPDFDLASSYLKNIERFCSNIPRVENVLEIPITNKNGYRLNVGFTLQGPM